MYRPETKDDSLLQTLATAASRIAYQDGDFTTAVPGLAVFRRSGTTEPLHCIFGFGVGIVISGRKRVMLGDEVFDYAGGQSLLTTADLPVITHVTEASAGAPYLGLMLNLDLRDVAQVAAEMTVADHPKVSGYRAMSLGSLEPKLLETVTRLVQLLTEPALVAHIAPLLQREILVRLLAGPHGAQLRRVASLGSPVQQVAKSMAWLKQHFAQPVVADRLASSAHMSPSTFRQHFRAMAGMSPIQYVKQLRLQEARHLMMDEGLDAGTAGSRVGYESVSQFSREYARLFGQPPLRDIKRLREAA